MELRARIHEITSRGVARPIDHARLRAEQVRLLYAYTPAILVAMVANSLILVLVLWKVISQVLLLVWFALSLVVVWYRVRLYREFRHSSPEAQSASRWATHYMVGLAASGALMGSTGLLLFPESSLVHQVFLVFLLGGMVAGVAGACSVVFESFLIYSVPTLFPTAVRLLMQESQSHVAMGGLLLIFFAIMLLTAYSVHMAIRRSLELRIENVNLIGELSEAKAEAEEVVEALRSEIAERVETEKALQQSEQKFRSLVETMNEGIGVMDTNGIITYVNDKLCEMLGYFRGELIGRSAMEFTDVADDFVLEQATAWRRLHKRTSFEMPFVTRNKRRIPTLVSASPIFDQDGSLKGIIAAITDTTILKRAEKELSDQLHFLQTLIDTIPNPVFYKDKNGLYLGCNKAFEERIGLRRQEIIGKSVYDVLPLELAESYHEMDVDLFDHYGELVIERSIVFADGKPHEVIVNKGIFTDADGHLAGLVGVNVDITERKKAEEALQKAHDELERRVVERTAELARAIEELRNEIDERMRAEEALRESSEKFKLFAYSVAHDLKSPAVGIYGLTRLLHSRYSDLLDERGKNYCEKILKASEHVAALVEEINVYAAAKEAPLTFEVINVKEILRMVREEFSARLSVRGIRWVEDVPALEIRADRLSLLRIFRNLVDNALKYAGEHLSEVGLGYSEAEAFHTFSVSDDGVGLKLEDSKKIFGVFQRNRTSKGIEGTGLGLAIVKELTERHKGEVWVEPGAEKGTTFYIAISKHL